jgi:hypothetical protein
LQAAWLHQATFQTMINSFPRALLDVFVMMAALCLVTFRDSERDLFVNRIMPSLNP